MHNIKYLLPYLRHHRLAIVVGMIAITAGAGFSVLQPYVLRLAIDSLSSAHPSLTRLTLYVILFLAAAGGQSLFAFVQRSSITRVSRFLEYEMRNDAFRHLQALDQPFYQEMHTGDLMARLTNDLNQVRQFVGMGMITIIQTTVMVTAVGIAMVIINWRLAIVAFAVLPLVTITMVTVSRAMQKRFRGVQDQFGQLSTHAQENFSGIRAIKAFVQEEREIAAFASDNEEYVRRSLGYARFSSIMWPLMFLVVGIALALVLFVGGREVASRSITLGQFVQFNFYLGMLTWPLISLGWVVNLYQQGIASMSRIMEVMTRPPEIRNTGRTLPIEHIEGAIEFRQVGVKRGDSWVFRDVSFRVDPGTTVAVVGTTGAGKSTLMDLVPRVLEADEGEVLIDGVDVRRIPLTTLRAAVGFVPQDTFLFSATLRENTMFGVDETSEEALSSALTTARLSKDLEQFPAGLDTIVGERGVSLSGGQKQRATLARAILRDPTILLLDDALSSVDTHTQSEILQGLKRVMAERTTLITSMRISTIKDADKIVVLDEGRVAEEGTHAELLRNNGLYAQMYRRELLRQELEVE